MIVRGFTEPGSSLENHAFFSMNFVEMELSIATVCQVIWSIWS